MTFGPRSMTACRAPPVRNKPPSEAGVADQLAFDFQKQEVRGRYRAVPMPIGSMNKTDGQLILQGTDLSFAWSAVIFLKDGNRRGSTRGIGLFRPVHTAITCANSELPQSPPGNSGERVVHADAIAAA